MKIVRKIHRSLTGVLGHDCDGKPLRAGDMVRIERTHPYYYSRFLGQLATVDRVATEPNRLVIDVDFLPGEHVTAPPDYLRRIDHPDSASWDEVSKATGWTPKIEAPARTEEVAEQ
jgi:hypothetical protein